METNAKVFSGPPDDVGTLVDFPCGTTFVVPLSSFKTQVAGQAVQHDSQSADNGTVTHSRSTTQVRSPQLYQAMQQCTRLCKRLCYANARRSVGAVARASAMPFLTVEIKSTTEHKALNEFRSASNVAGTSKCLVSKKCRNKP